MKIALRITLVLVLLLGGGLLLKGLLSSDPIVVAVHVVDRGTVEETVANSRAGTVRARRRAELSTGTSGIVQELSVQRGNRVENGALLLRLEDSTQRAALLLSERDLSVSSAALERACLSADRARREYERNEELSDGIVSADRLDALSSALAVAEAECRVRQAEVNRAEAAIEASRAELAKTELRAPFDAIIAEVECELGEWVTPSVPLMAAPPLIDAIDPSSLYISAPMDEVDAASLKVGLPARVTIDPFPDRIFPGMIARVAPYVLDVEQQNRTLEIEVELEDTTFSATLLPGTTADVEVVLDRTDDTLRIPTLALLEGGRVLIVSGESLEEREPTFGRRNWQWVEVLSGLEEGDEVVTSLDRDGVEAGASVEVEGSRRESEP